MKEQQQQTRRAMVTGASGGIGRSFAQQLAKKGYQLTLVSRNRALLEALAGDLPGKHDVLVADLSIPEELGLVESTLRGQHFHLLVNNAGSGLYGNYHQATWAKLSAILQLNCTALARLAHAYLQTAAQGDALINVSSIMALLPQSTSAMYCATKAFVTTLSEALWFENKARGIYVMGLHPGMTRTDFRVRAGGTPVYPKSAHSADDVVRRGLAALAVRTAPTVVCGKLNALICTLPRALTRKQMVSYLGKTRSYEPSATRSGT